MREWVVKLLGGYSWRQFDSFRIEVDKQVKYAAAEVDYYRSILKDKDQEIARLTNLMLTRAGFIVLEGNSQGEIKHEPINARKSWRSRQRELELADVQKLADETERRWREKPGAVFVGDEKAEGSGLGNSELVG